MLTSRRELLRSAGMLAGAAALSTTGGCTQTTTPVRRSAAPNLKDLHDIQDYQRAAKTVMAPMAWEYISGGAADEITLRWNHEACERIRLKPRALVDVSHLDTRVRILG